MSFVDDMLLWEQRFNINLPQGSAARTSVFYQEAAAFISAVAQLEQLVIDSSNRFFLSNAQGSDLDARGADFGVSRYAGVASACPTVIFTLSSVYLVDTYVDIGTLCSTQASGTMPAITFATTQATTIPAGQLSSPAVPVMCQQAGTIGNVAAGTITIAQSAAGGGSLSVSNTAAASGGADPESDSVYRARIYASIASKFTSPDLAGEILSVSGVTDAYIYDPQDGSGQIIYYWADVNGLQLGASAAAVDAAIRTVLPASVIPVAQAFGVITLTSVTYTYSADPSVASATIEQQFDTAVVNYLNGLTHGTAPTAFQITQAATSGTTYRVIDFTVTGIAPTIVTPVPSTIIYKIGGVSSVVGTRV